MRVRVLLIKFRRFLKKMWVPLTVHVWPFGRLWYRIWGLALEGSPNDLVWYFAYGANMHDSIFRDRRKMHPKEWRIGRIRHYRLRFNLEGLPLGKAAPANITPEEHAEIWGVLYLITRRQMVWLNATEGVPGWRYKPTWIEAEDSSGGALTVFTYIANGLEKDGMPSKRYITLLREGARLHGLPKPWIDYLNGVKHAD